MSLTQISSHLLTNTINIQERTNTRDSVGDYSEVWNDIASGVKAAIMPVTRKEIEHRELSQGREFTATHKCFFNVNDISATIKDGQRIYNTENGKYYDVVTVQKWEVYNTNITSGHHYKLYLEITRDTKS